MKFGYTIIYTPNVPASLKFFNEAFGVATRFIHESETYGELETGSTALAFAAAEMGDEFFPGGHVSASSSELPLGMAVALIYDDVPGAHARALATGAKELCKPEDKPWGQTVSYVRCPDGTLVELCTPVRA